jgi:membrane-associated protease RseP (regulator of RpoE activity)
MASWQIAVAVIIFAWFILTQLSKRGKINLEVHSILLILKTERGKDFISNISRHTKFWKVFSTSAIVIGYLGLFLMVLQFIYIFYRNYLSTTPLPEEAVKVVIPMLTTPWYSIFGLVILLVVHEFAHGIVARSEKITIKNLGLVFITAIPIGAFVEPDEDELKRSSKLSQLRVFAAGSFANILVAAIVLVFLVLTSSFYQNPYLHIAEVMEGTPAYGILETGMIIEEINGVEVSSYIDFFSVTNGTVPGQQVEIRTDKGTFTLTAIETDEYPGKGIVGFKVTSLKEGPVGFVYLVLQWVWFLNLGIGLMNWAPVFLGIAATDGHHMLKILISRFSSEETSEKIAMTISSSIMIFIIFLLVGPKPG